ncbi:MAG: hypothetical protein QOG53_1726 [Frankiales bacterium]|jgi:hypothetical protein|nr:hypothetical protein [Frankiales bacterium]
MDRITRERVVASHPMAMLGAGVPLSLLFDLLALDLPSSREIARTERADAEWVHRAA